MKWLILLIIIIGLFMISGCIEEAELDIENESSIAIGSVVKQIAEGYEKLNPPYENIKENESNETS